MPHPTNHSLEDTDALWQRDEIASPCVKVCVIHPQERICVGCYRTTAEIARWARMAKAERAAIIEQLPERSERLRKRRGGRAGRSRRNSPNAGPAASG